MAIEYNISDQCAIALKQSKTHVLLVNHQAHYILVGMTGIIIGI